MTLLAHDREYATNFLACALPDAIKRRIGLQDALDDPVLVQRTMAEVSGAPPRCEYPPGSVLNYHSEAPP